MSQQGVMISSASLMSGRSRILKESSQHFANIFAFRDIWPMDVYRRTDFASSSMPQFAYSPVFMNRIREMVNEGVLPVSQGFALAGWITSSKLMHFGLMSKDINFTRKERAEACQKIPNVM